MSDDKKVGRLVGLGMLLGFVVGMVSNFKLQADLFAGGGLLVNAAAHPEKIGMITLLGIVTALVSVAIAALIAARYRDRSPVLLLVYLGIIAVGAALSMLEYVSLLSFGRLSELYLAAGPEAAGQHQAANAVLSGLRNGVHYIDKLVGGIGVVVMFVIFYRLRLVPRVLAGLSILAVQFQLFAVGSALFGTDINHALLAPMALMFMVATLWLLAVGFASPSAARPLTSA